MIKKALSSILSLTLLIALFGCGESVETSVTARNTEQSTEEDTSPVTDAPYSGEEGSATSFSVANYFHDDMIVQRDKPIVIWGTAPESEEGKIVEAELLGSRGFCPVSNGKWEITLHKTLSPSNDSANTLTVRGAEGTEEKFTNVAVGDIWILSGQSDAEMTFAGTLAGTGKAIQALYKDDLVNYSSALRLLRQSDSVLKDSMTADPQDDIYKSFRWKTASKGSVVGSSVATSFSVMGFFFGKRMLELNPEVPVGIISACNGGASLAMLVSEEADAKLPRAISKTAANGIPVCGIYNAFIAPLERISIKGVIFNQGDTDAVNARFYAKGLKVHIADLRSHFGEDMLFINAQTSSFGLDSGGIPLVGGMWDCIQDVRFAQTAVKTDGDTAGYEIVSCIDLGWRKGDLDGAHPYYKKEIGYRMAEITAAVYMGIGDAEQVGCPYPNNVEYTDTSVTVSFAYAGGELKTMNGAALAGFEVMIGKTWQKCDAVIDGNKVIISTDSAVQGVRYAGKARYPTNDDANLCSGTGYAAVGFEFEIK